MPTVSIVRLLAGGISLLFVAASGGCLSRPGVVTDRLLEPIGPAAAWLPGRSDLDAARLTRLALVSHTQSESTVDRALDRLVESAAGSDTRRLVPLAVDLRNATLDDPIADREASRALRRRRGLDPRLRERLDRIIADDPLRLARKRSADGWHRLWARTFNAVAEPLGSSVITGFVLAPYQLGNSLIHYLADFSNLEPLSLTDRQALAHRKQFLAAHPDTELTTRLERKIETAEIELEKTLALRRVRGAERALDAGQPRLAAHHAASAQRVLAAHPENNGRLRRRAERAGRKAADRLAVLEVLRRRSLDAEPTATDLVGIETRIAARLLAGPTDLESLDPLLDELETRSGRADRGELVRALVQSEQGFETAASRRLGRLAAKSDRSSSMARHARTLLEDDWQNPYGAFKRLRARGRRDELGWRLAGEWLRRPRYPNLPAPVAYLIDAPTIAITIVLAPLRALVSPWTGAPDFQRGTAFAGYRYLQRHPGGDHQRDVLEWLYDYERKHERWDRALRLADLRPEPDPSERAKLVEKAARARVASLDRLDRRDFRTSMLEGVAQEFPDSETGKEAGLRAREEWADASAQHIRLTRDFLRENPEVAGPHGIGLSPELINGDPGDGELHPEGVVLRGGRILEIRLIADGGDEDDPPEPSLRPISAKRLARIAAALDEAVRRNGLVDVDARQDADAKREVFLERARLGLAEDVDRRPTAESRFVYRSLRERYGLVRGRESLLPFDLVFRGSLGDFTLGAFPRWRPPRETPDAFLFR